MNRYFNLKRFGLLCKNEILSKYKSWSIYFVTIMGIYIAISFIIAAANRYTGLVYDPNSLNYMFPGFLFLGGYIVSSLIFLDINDKFKSSLWFSIPGSTLEKYLVGVVVSSIGYSIFLILAFTAASLFSKLVTMPFFGTGMAVFNPFTLGAIHEIGFTGLNMFLFIQIYILTHSIFLVGSIVFRKGAFIKTILVISVVQTILSIIIGLIVFFVIKSGISVSWDVRVFQSVQKFLEYNIYQNTAVSIIYRLVFILGLIFSLFFNIVGYFKLSEKEVKGGI